MYKNNSEMIVNMNIVARIKFCSNLKKIEFLSRLLFLYQPLCITKLENNA